MDTKWYAVISGITEEKTGVDAKSEQQARNAILDNLTSMRNYDALKAWSENLYEVTTNEPTVQIDKWHVDDFYKKIFGDNL